MNSAAYVVVEQPDQVTSLGKRHEEEMPVSYAACTTAERQTSESGGSQNEYEYEYALTHVAMTMPSPHVAHLQPLPPILPTVVTCFNLILALMICYLYHTAWGTILLALYYIDFVAYRTRNKVMLYVGVAWKTFLAGTIVFLLYWFYANAMLYHYLLAFFYGIYVVCDATHQAKFAADGE